MGGRIEVTSPNPEALPGQGPGSVFTLTLPLLVSRDQSSPSPDLPVAVAVFDRDTRVLLVEDHEINQMVISIMLRNLGIKNVTLASNGLEAVEKVRAGNFHLVLMDMQMPVLDGISATEQIRALGRRMPIIALTANALGNDRDRCFAAGMNDYLTKPINRVVFADTIGRWLAKAVGGPPLDAEAGVIDLGEAVDRVGDRTLIIELLGEFMEMLPATVAEIEVALRDGKPSELAFLAHRLKSAATNLALVGLSKAAYRLESSALKGGGPPEFEGLVAAIAEEAQKASACFERIRDREKAAAGF